MTPVIQRQARLSRAKALEYEKRARARAKRYLAGGDAQMANLQKRTADRHHEAAVAAGELLRIEAAVERIRRNRRSR
jgi:hypothetical protein